MGVGEALEEEEAVTWERFKELFLEKYFPRYMQNQMELKFFELRHENSSVIEYERSLLSWLGLYRSM